MFGELNFSSYITCNINFNNMNVMDLFEVIFSVLIPLWVIMWLLVITKGFFSDIITMITRK